MLPVLCQPPIRIALTRDDVVPHCDIFRTLRPNGIRNPPIAGAFAADLAWCPNAIRAGALSRERMNKKLRAGWESPKTVIFAGQSTPAPSGGFHFAAGGLAAALSDA
jgi:hypothetical protein